MRAILNLLCWLAGLAAALFIVIYLRALTGPNLGMGLLVVQLYLAITSGAAFALGLIARLAWRGEPPRGGTVALIAGLVGGVLLGGSLLLG